MEIVNYSGTGKTINVPLFFTIWIRPECQRKQFEIIRKVKPAVMFIQSDGGRNDYEWKAILENRKMVDEGIDWTCTVYKFYETENNGMYAMISKTQPIVWKTVDRCIFLEDDHIPAISFFSYCDELLAKYINDSRIECICGMNHLGVYDRASADYFFSRQGSIWGIATWRRTWEEWSDYAYGKDSYIMELLKERTRHNKTIWNRIKTYAERDICDGHIAGTEFWIEFDMYAQNRLQIIPKRNMINCVGATYDSAHSGVLKEMPKRLRQVFNMDVYELTEPLIHPRYIIPDVEYEKRRNRMINYNPNLWNKITWKMEHAILYIKERGLIKTILILLERFGVINAGRIEK